MSQGGVFNKGPQLHNAVVCAGVREAACMCAWQPNPASCFGRAPTLMPALCSWEGKENGTSMFHLISSPLRVVVLGGGRLGAGAAVEQLGVRRMADRCIQTRPINPNPFQLKNANGA